MTFPTITMKELEQYIESGKDMEIIDVRNQASFQHCHLKGARNIPMNELENQLATLPKDKLLFFYCSRGGQSMLACNQLSRMGYQVVNIANGISFYQGKYLIQG